MHKCTGSTTASPFIAQVCGVALQIPPLTVTQASDFLSCFVVVVVYLLPLILGSSVNVALLAAVSLVLLNLLRQDCSVI